MAMLESSSRCREYFGQASSSGRPITRSGACQFACWTQGSDTDPRPEVSPAADRDRTLLRCVAAFAIVAGAALRVVTWRSQLGVLDGDEAVWGLMARHIL